MMTETRLELSLMQLFLLTIFLNIVSASRCTDVARIAMSEITKIGTSWINCDITEVTCLPEGTYRNGTVTAQCINVGTVKACGISGGQLQPSDACGVYVGTTSSRFASFVSGTATSPFIIDREAWHVLVNWPNLGYVNNVGMCCSESACSIIQLATVQTNECDPGYGTIKCAGDEHHGVCSEWTGDYDSGLYFLVNADAPLPPLATIVNSSLDSGAAIVNSSSGSSTSPVPTSTLSISDSTASPSALSARRGATVPAWAIALICALGLAVLALSLLFARHVRVRRKIDRDQLSIDPASSGPPAIVPLITRPMGVTSDAQMMSGGDMALQEALSPPRYAKVAALY